MNKGKRDEEGNLGQSGTDAANPAGTSGRQDNTGGNSQPGNADTNRPARRPRNDDDEDSGLGNRTGLR